MKKAIPRWFTALLVAVLLLCSAVVALTLFREASLTAQINDVQTSLTAAQGRLRKQQQEYAEYTAALPEVLAELAEIQPQAAAAYEQEQALRQQRKDLRAENAALAEELSALQSQSALDSSNAAQTADALTYLQNALADINALQQLEQ